MEITHLFLTRHYDINDTEKCTMIKLAREERTAICANINDIGTRDI